jgi:hypothetical protein
MIPVADDSAVVLFLCFVNSLIQWNLFHCVLFLRKGKRSRPLQQKAMQYFCLSSGLQKEIAPAEAAAADIGVPLFLGILCFSCT